MLPPLVAVLPSVVELFCGDNGRGVSGYIRYLLNEGDFDRIHATHALDQPTIFKWLFWFTMETILAVPYMAIMGWISDRRKTSTNIAYFVALIFVCAVLLCTLGLPAKWLLQYMHQMGYTPRRIAGLVYCLVASCGVLGFFLWAIKKPTITAADEAGG